jgi:hypothetical protein
LGIVPSVNKRDYLNHFLSQKKKQKKENVSDFLLQKAKTKVQNG